MYKILKADMHVCVYYYVWWRFTKGGFVQLFHVGLHNI